MHLDQFFVMKNIFLIVLFFLRARKSIAKPIKRRKKKKKIFPSVKKFVKVFEEKFFLHMDKFLHTWTKSTYYIVKFGHSNTQLRNLTKLKREEFKSATYAVEK